MDLWVLPSPAQSPWFARVDWYLNWQMCKCMVVERRKPSADLVRVIEENGLRYEPPVTGAGSPLMVISEGRIPCAKCVVIDQAKSLSDWLKAVWNTAAGLGARHIRIFLPSGSQSVEAESLWRKFNHDGSIQAEFCTDEGAL